ncbi:MAG: hypothetical protein ACYDAC_12650 [Candidatus Dormibacteria bacterium]
MPAPDVTALIESAIRGHLVLSVSYVALDGTMTADEVEPLAIRFNSAKHRVLWCRNRDAGHIEQLLWDRIEGAAATGLVFTPKPWAEDG